jgi:hypothetical protein
MGTLKERILADRQSYMKDPEKRMSLGTLLGELDRVSKTPTDNEVIKAIQTMIEGNIEVGKPEGLKENELIKIYIPDTLTDEQVTDIVIKYIRQNNICEVKQMGQVMKHLSENYAGRYNGQNVANMVKTSIQVNKQHEAETKSETKPEDKK